jgi:methionyl-tRNA formyltransferase
MRVAIIGRQAFGKAALEAFAARGDAVVAAFVPPPQAGGGGRPDDLAAAAAERGIPVHAPRSYSSPEALDTLRRLDADLAVMAYVLALVPQSFCTIPRLGTIQFHPSLLPLHRGPSAINWAIIRGRTRTGLTIFRPTDGLDEGPVLLQKDVEILPDDTVGSVYFDKVFPLGIAALLETADLIAAGRATETVQDESQATYEGWVRGRESCIHWGMHVDIVYNLIRGCNPAPGAWTTMADGRRLQLFDARKRIAPTFASVRDRKPGEVVAVGERSFTVFAPGGFIEVLRCRFEAGPKIGGGAAGLSVGTIFGDGPA